MAEIPASSWEACRSHKLQSQGEVTLSRAQKTVRIPHHKEERGLYMRGLGSGKSSISLSWALDLGLVTWFMLVLRKSPARGFKGRRLDQSGTARRAFVLNGPAVAIAMQTRSSVTELPRWVRT